MLHDFLIWNRTELIRRSAEKARQRPVPHGAPSTLVYTLEHGVPLFLDQLSQVLRREQTNAETKHNAMVTPSRRAPSAENTRNANLHGKELLDRGYTVAQVVHDYGDICQAITELAKERNVAITVDEFHTFNRMLDNAIADAVTSYSAHRDASLSAQGSEDLHERLGALAEQQRTFLDRALNALEAIKIGNVGVRGATGAALEESLLQLRILIDQSLPEIRLASGMTRTPTRQA